MILLIDNYDSFSYNLYQLIGEIEPDIRVIRNDEMTVEEIRALKPDRIILSPGPGRPEDAGVIIAVAKELGKEIPILGVCLGHQIIATALGGKLSRGESPEIGFAPIKRVDKHNYFSMWNKQIDVLHWHNDVVGLPAGAQLLARSEHTKVQAFRIGSALGMQFHLEVTPTLLEEWLDESSMVKDLKAVGGSKSQLREAFAEYNPRLQPLAEQVFGGFAARCNTYAQSLR